MRRLLAVLVGAVLLLTLGQRYLSWDGDCLTGRQARWTVRPCEDADRDHAAAVDIEDERLKETLIREGKALIDQDRTADARVLVKQASTDRYSLDLSQAASSGSDPVAVFRTAKDSVVVVGGLYRCDKCTRWHATTASGFVLSESGAVVTNYHVVDSPDERALVVMTADQHVYPVQRILATNRSDDLAILQVDAEGLKPLPLADNADAAPVGSAVSVISHPDGRFYCCTVGVVSRYTKIRVEGEPVDAVTITADYARGSSGAPVLNNQGQVVAVVRSTESVYYTETRQRQLDLQMVFKTCVPVASLRRIIQPPNQIAGWKASEATAP
jgi:S1-C subfamily serine protease